jgi:hypothetical protein
VINIASPAGGLLLSFPEAENDSVAGLEACWLWFWGLLLLGGWLAGGLDVPWWPWELNCCCWGAMRRVNSGADGLVPLTGATELNIVPGQVWEAHHGKETGNRVLLGSMYF